MSYTKVKVRLHEYFDGHTVREGMMTDESQRKMLQVLRLHKLGMVARAATSAHPAHKAKDVPFTVPTPATPTVSAASSTPTSRIMVTSRASSE